MHTTRTDHSHWKCGTAVHNMERAWFLFYGYSFVYLKLSKNQQSESEEFWCFDSRLSLVWIARQVSRRIVLHCFRQQIEIGIFSWNLSYEHSYKNRHWIINPPMHTNFTLFSLDKNICWISDCVIFAIARNLNYVYRASRSSRGVQQTTTRSLVVHVVAQSDVI